MECSIKMKKYFVASDTHSFYTPFIKELNKTGFDLNNEEHILIICGDLSIIIENTPPSLGWR